jgi:hypothetical protein
MARLSSTLQGEAPTRATEPLPLEGGGRNAVQTGMMGNRIDREDG